MSQTARAALNRLAEVRQTAVLKVILAGADDPKDRQMIRLAIACAERNAAKL